MVILVLINASGGTAKSLGEDCATAVERAFAEADLAADVRLVEGADMARAARAAAAEGGTVVIGGGDGTLGCGAGALAGAGATLGILPLGTFNHLARELGIPGDLGAAAKLIATGVTRRVDLARVNGHVFVNNASIGFYPKLVQLREDAQEHGWPKWLAALHASGAALKRLRHHRLRLRMGGDTRAVLTPMLFVGNNRYELKLGKVGQRAALDDGLLSVFAVTRGSRRALIGVALRTLIGRADAARDFAALGDSPDLTVTGHARDIAVALDGELTRLALPLRFESMPGALTVIAPPA